MQKRSYLILALISLAMWGLVHFLNQQSNALKPGEPAIEFIAKDLQAKPVKLSDYHGSVVLLNFWASWCGPCQAEMPSLNALYKRYHSENKPFVVIGLSQDDSATAVVDFLKNVPVDFPILMDEEMKISEQYQTFRIPESYLIDKEGKLVEKIYGPHEWDTQGFWDKINRLL